MAATRTTAVAQHLGIQWPVRPNSRRGLFSANGGLRVGKPPTHLKISSVAYSTPKQPPIPMQTLPLIPIQSRPRISLNTRQWALVVAGWLVMGYNVAHLPKGMNHVY